MKVYKVVVVRDGGLRDVIAEFDTRERAERFVEQIKAIDREARLEIVEAEEGYLALYRAISAMAILIVICAMLATLSRGGRRVV